MSAAILLAELAAADPDRRQAALARLAAADDPVEEDAIPAVVACLGLPRKAGQRLAADLLQRVAPAGRDAVLARLRTAIAADEPRLRWGATYALGRLGLTDPVLIAPLLEAMGTADGDQRWAAAALLAACARAHREIVIAALLAAVEDREPERRKMALYVLRDTASSNPDVSAAAMRGLVDPALGVRFAALAVLIRLEPIPAGACGGVLALVHDDPDPGLRRAALCALGNVGRGISAAETAIAAAAASADPLMRRAAQIARRRLGGAPPSDA